MAAILSFLCSMVAVRAEVDGHALALADPPPVPADHVRLYSAVRPASERAAYPNRYWSPTLHAALQIGPHSSAVEYLDVPRAQYEGSLSPSGSKSMVLSESSTPNRKPFLMARGIAPPEFARVSVPVVTADLRRSIVVVADTPEGRAEIEAVRARVLEVLRAYKGLEEPVRTPMTVQEAEALGEFRKQRVAALSAEMSELAQEASDRYNTKVERGLGGAPRPVEPIPRAVPEPAAVAEPAPAAKNAPSLLGVGSAAAPVAEPARPSTASRVAGGFAGNMLVGVAIPPLVAIGKQLARGERVDVATMGESMFTWKNLGITAAAAAGATLGALIPGGQLVKLSGAIAGGSVGALVAGGVHQPLGRSAAGTTGAIAGAVALSWIPFAGPIVGGLAGHFAGELAYDAFASRPQRLARAR